MRLRGLGIFTLLLVDRESCLANQVAKLAHAEFLAASDVMPQILPSKTDVKVLLLA